jgi:hypothetical protein
MNNEKTSLDKLRGNIARSISGSDDAGEDIFNLYVDVVLDLISNGMTLKKATDLVDSINNIHMKLMVRLYNLVPTNRSDE